MQQYQYSDGTIGPAQQVSHHGQVYPAHYLAQRAAETEAEWIARIAVIDVTPVRVEPWIGDPNTQAKGDPVEVMDGGWLVISWPTPLAKTAVWSTSTRERMYIMPSAAVPPGYTLLEPVDGVYSSWSGEGWTYNTDLKAAHVRADRDQRLTACDWTQLPDCPLDETAQAAWATYRQALRDVPDQAGFPQDVTWPKEPA